MKQGFLDEYTIKPNIFGGQPRKKQTLPKKEDNRFIKGPIQWKWVCAASKLPGKTLNVAMGLLFIKGLTKSDKVKMQGRLLHELSVSHQTYNKALRHLEEAGLVLVERRPGQTPTVTILNS